MSQESYWIFVEPIWDAVSIYDSAEEFIAQFAKISKKQQVLFATHWAQSEIQNGGLGQFFSNSTGVLAPEAVAGFSALGMPKCASALANAMRFFGDTYPRETGVRQDVLESFEAEHEGEVPLLEYEDIMAIEIEEERGGFEEAANRYANQN
jgi:Domain of unknown function (DUF4375)